MVVVGASLSPFCGVVNLLLHAGCCGESLLLPDCIEATVAPRLRNTPVFGVLFLCAGGTVGYGIVVGSCCGLLGCPLLVCLTIPRAGGCFTDWGVGTGVLVAFEVTGCLGV